MKNIEQLTVTQVRLYPVDSLPLDELRQLNNRNIIKNSFQFDKAQVDPLTNQVIFNNGTFEEGKQLVHILNLAVKNEGFYSRFGTVRWLVTQWQPPWLVYWSPSKKIPKLRE